MSNQHDFNEANRRERERLAGLVARLSPADLARPVSPGWTVADALAHMAFWDWRALALVKQWEREPFSLPPEHPIDGEALNEAAWRLAQAVSPQVAAQLALAAAEEVDGRIASLPPEMVAAIVAEEGSVNLWRSEHRAEHLDEFERVLKQS
jgi:hypothetical protein